MNPGTAYLFPARLTHAEAMRALDELKAALSSGVRVVDLSGLAEFDSSALAVLLAARRACTEEGVPRFVNVPDKLSRLAGLYGLESLVFAHP